MCRYVEAAGLDAGGVLFANGSGVRFSTRAEFALGFAEEISTLVASHFFSLHKSLLLRYGTVVVRTNYIGRFCMLIGVNHRLLR
jgi:hypothetical protein